MASTELHQQQDLTLTQRMTQQHYRFVKMLEMSAPELADAVDRELEANPALTTLDLAAGSDDPADRAVANAAAGAGLSILSTASPSARNSNSYSPRYNEARDPNAADLPSFSPRDDSESLADVLSRQIAERHIDPQVRELAEYIIGNLDNNGWLTRSLPQMMTDFAIAYNFDPTRRQWDEAFNLVRSLEPAGVGATSLVDCLSLQLHRLPDSQQKEDALKILSDFFREYHMRHSHKIISGMKISRERLDEANKLILSLNPKPGAAYGGNDSTAAAVIVPDFIISGRDGELFIRLANRNPELAIEESFREAARSLEIRKANARKGNEFIINNYNDARDFITLLRRRQATLMSVMTAIAAHQKEYLISSDVFLMRPMSLKDLASATGLDVSTISRATNNKYVALPWGEVIPLRSLFSVQVNAAASDADRQPQSEHGDELTNAQIQSAIRELVEKEDPRHPLSDAKLQSELAAKGYDISRRTVAKYRDRAGIAIARLRKKL